MIEITRDEASAIFKNFKNVVIVKTKNKRYVENGFHIERFLNSLRSGINNKTKKE